MEKLIENDDLHINKLLDMGNTTFQCKCDMDVDKPLFEPTPSCIVFDTFVEGEIYSKNIKFRNMDKIPRLITVNMQDSQYFRIIRPKNVGCKIGAGLVSTFVVQFLPQQKRDYSHKIKCITEREEFDIQICAIGPRANIDVPKRVRFQNTLVHKKQNKTVLVTNIGSQAGYYKFISSDPSIFFVSPASGKVEVEGILQLEFTFIPNVAKTIKGKITLCYDTGESIPISMIGRGLEQDINLEKRSIKIDDTYVTCCRQDDIEIINQSPNDSNYYWSTFPTDIEENKYITDRKNNLINEYREKVQMLNEMNGLSDPIVRDRLAIAKQALESTLNCIDEEKFHNKMDYIERNFFKIEPVSGLIHSNSSCACNIKFEPKTVGEYKTVLYCRIEGRQKRVPFDLRATSMGAKLELSLDTLDLENCFIGSKHSYDFEISNRCPIDASFESLGYTNTCAIDESDFMQVWHTNCLKFSQYFSFKPTEKSIQPLSTQCITIDFQPKSLGHFNIPFSFRILNNPNLLHLNVVGSCVGPSFEINKETIDMGVVAFGFPQSTSFKIKNTSQTKFKYHVRFSEKNYTNSFCLEKVEKILEETSLELSVSKNCNGIEPGQEDEIELYYNPMNIGFYTNNVIIDLEDIEKEACFVAFNAKSQVPKIYCRDSIDMGKCFVRHKYEKVVVLVNDTDLKAIFNIESDNMLNSQKLLPITYKTKDVSGIIEPKSEKPINLSLFVNNLGTHNLSFFTTIVGSKKPKLHSIFTATGVGGVVDINPTFLNWGTIKALKNVTKQITFDNQSPINVDYQLSFQRHDTPWSLESDKNGTILAFQKIFISLFAKLPDTLKYEDNLIIKFSENNQILFNLKAVGYGSTIITVPSLVNEVIDLGHYCRQDEVGMDIMVKNMGVRHRSLVWNLATILEGTCDKKLQKESIFSINPVRLELGAGESTFVRLQAKQKDQKETTTIIQCHALTSGVGGKNLIIDNKIKCQFITPVIKCSSWHISFQVSKMSVHMDEMFRKQIFITNDCEIGLTCTLTVESPFYFVKDNVECQEIETCLESRIDKENCVGELIVGFNPNCNVDKFSRLITRYVKVVYSNYSKKEYIKMSANVIYPNIVFDLERVNFGCVSSNIELNKYINLKNTTPGEVNFQFLFEKCEIQDKDNMLEQLDIYPKFGSLQINESIDVVLSYCGSENDSINTNLICCVQNGPQYAIPITASCSHLKYNFSTKIINVGLTPFRKEMEIPLKLDNCGKVDLSFQQLNHLNNYSNDAKIEIVPSKSKNNKIQLCPPSGFIKGGENMTIIIKYTPLYCAKFKSEFWIQVGCSEPECFEISGIAYYLRMTMDLPLFNNQDANIKKLKRMAISNLKEKCISKLKKLSLNLKESSHPYKIQFNVQNNQQENDIVIYYNNKSHFSSPRENDVEYPSIDENISIETLTQGCDHQDGKISPMSDIAKVKSLGKVDITAEQIHTEMDYIIISEYSKLIQNNENVVKPRLCDYYLDFGYVLIDDQICKNIILSNCSVEKLIIKIDRGFMIKTGFSIDVGKIIIPGNKSCCTHVVPVYFDSHYTKIGHVTSTVALNIKNGPQICVQLHAYVTRPELNVSSDVVDFGTTVCGQSRMIVVQLKNIMYVPANWNIGVKNTNHFHRFHKEDSGTLEKSKLKSKSRSNLSKVVYSKCSNFKRQNRQNFFELMPSSGKLDPSEFTNLQILFIPTHECIYEERIIINVATQKLTILCRGSGIEPKIEFDNELLHFGSILPYTNQVERKIVVNNPCSFPVEIYNLQCDGQYLEEEQILRIMKGYDERNMLLLPTRKPGDKLPEELLSYYKDKLLQLIHTNENPVDAADDYSYADGGSTNREKTEYHELDLSPTIKALARYLNVDLSLEGQVAKNCRGIALIINGTPFSGSTKLAHKLASHYNSFAFKIDDFIVDEIKKGSSENSKKVRKMCADMANSYQKQKMTTESLQKEAMLSIDEIAANAACSVSPTKAMAEQMKLRRPTTNLGNVKGIKAESILASEAKNDLSHSTSLNESEIDFTDCVRLKISGIVHEPLNKYGYLSCDIPSEILMEMVAQRLTSDDCKNGVVFYGFQSIFFKDMPKLLTDILTALGNRKHIYGVTERYSYTNYLSQIRNEQKIKDKNARDIIEEEERLLNEISEDEYNSLASDRQEYLDKKRLQLKRERREKVRIEQERIERELTEQKRLEEEMKGNKKNKKKGTESSLAVNKSKHNIPNTAPTATNPTKDSKPNTARQDVVKHKDEEPTDSGATNESVDDVNEVKEESVVAKDKPKPNKKSKQLNKRGSVIPRDAINLDDSENISFTGKQKSPREMKIESLYRDFESSYKDYCYIFENWNRSTGTVKDFNSSDKENDEFNIGNMTSAPTTNKTKRAIKNRESTIDKDRNKSSVIQNKNNEDDENHPEALINDMGNNVRKNSTFKVCGVHHVEINRTINSNVDIVNSILSELPSYADIVDSLGYGPSGPPLPPPAFFDIIPYPLKREPPSESKYFSFIKDDVNGDSSQYTDAQKTGQEVETKQNEPMKPLDKLKQSKALKNSLKLKQTDNKRGSLNENVPEDNIQQNAETDQIKLISHEKYSPHRWIVPANDSVEIPFGFQSNKIGQHDTTLHFEIMGTRRQYQLHCRGICSYPSIISDPRLMFTNKIYQAHAKNAIISNSYVLDKNYYTFGPLLAGKTREKYLEYRYPENSEKCFIINESKIRPITVKFCFKEDNKAETFLLDPNEMYLQPNEKATLSIWAYPKAPGKYKDKLIICITENPEPILINIQCIGTRPEMELESKQLHFDKVLLHRKDTKCLVLKNVSMLSIDWRLTGLDILGEEFSISQESGTIAPLTTFKLNTYFRAIKPTNISKKNVRLEVYDTANQLGLIQTEIVQISAEAYDVALDLSFPKGTDGGLDLDAIRVGEEAKQTCSIKNKGKYELQYKFIMSPTATCGKHLCKLFNVFPREGSIVPIDRASQVTISFKADFECNIVEEPILKCNVIDPLIQQTIACIPIKVTVCNLFSKFKIVPQNDVNFGPMIVGNKKTRVFTIENTGEKFDFRYTVVRKNQLTPIVPSKMSNNVNELVNKKNGKGESFKRSDSISRNVSRNLGSRIDKTKGRLMSTIGKTGASPNVNNETPLNLNNSDNAKQTTTNYSNTNSNAQSRLVCGPFVITPAIGVIQPLSSQNITVECVAESCSFWNIELAIDISGRDLKSTNYESISYRLLASSAYPSIDLSNMKRVFEECQLVPSLEIWKRPKSITGITIYGLAENRLFFSNVLVGASCCARLRMENVEMVPCDLSLVVKQSAVATRGGTSGTGTSSSGRHSALQKNTEIFSIEPSKIHIDPHSAVYPTIKFTPPSLSHYVAHVEIIVENSSAQLSKGKSICVDLCGDGVLPHVVIKEPTMFNKEDFPVLVFTRLPIGSTDAKNIVIENTGTLNAQLTVEIIDPNYQFEIKNYTINGKQQQNNHNCNEEENVINLKENESVEIQTVYSAKSYGLCQAQMKISLSGNPYEDILVYMVGECIISELIITNVDSFDSDYQFKSQLVSNENVETPLEQTVSFSESFVSAAIPSPLKENVIILEGISLETKYVKYARLINNSDQIYKSFITVPEAFSKFIKTCPESFHILPKTSTIFEIISNFTEPGLQNEAVLNVKMTAISYKDENDQTTPWTNDLKQERWVSKMNQSTQEMTQRKIIDNIAEPAYNEQSDIPFTNLSLTILIKNWLNDKIVTNVDNLENNESSILQLIDSNLINDWKKMRKLTIGEIYVRIDSLSEYILKQRNEKLSLGPSYILHDQTTFDNTIQSLEWNFVGLNDGKSNNIILVNPTNEPVFFSLNRVDDSSLIHEFSHVVEFKIDNLHGCIHPCKIKSIAITCSSKCVGIVESLWQMTIFKKKKQYTKYLTANHSSIKNSVLKSDNQMELLFVVLVSEPALALDKSCIKFDDMLVGTGATETVVLVNDEDKHFNYQVDQESINNVNREGDCLLKISNLRGSVAPKSNTCFKISLSLFTSNSINTNILIMVNGRDYPFTINIKACGFVQECSLHLIGKDNNKTLLHSIEKPTSPKL